MSTVGRLPAGASRLAAVALGGRPRHAARRSRRRLVLRPDPRGPAGAAAPCRHPAHPDPRRRGRAARQDGLPARRRPGDLERRRRADRRRTAARGRPARSASRCPTSAPRSSATPPTSRAATRARSTPPGSSRFAAARRSSQRGSRRACATPAWPRSADGLRRRRRRDDRDERRRLPIRPSTRQVVQIGDAAAAGGARARSSRSAGRCT